MASKFAVFSHTDNICKKSAGKYIFSGSTFSIAFTICSHQETNTIISSNKFS